MSPPTDSYLAPTFRLTTESTLRNPTYTLEHITKYLKSIEHTRSEIPFRTVKLPGGASAGDGLGGRISLRGRYADLSDEDAVCFAEALVAF